MTFTILKEKEFKKFLDNSNEKTFLQTPSIAHLREKEGWTPYYLGVKENNKIICATMIVSKKRHFGKYEFYAPRGFLIDYKNYELLKYFTEEIKKFVKKNNGYIFNHIRNFNFSFRSFIFSIVRDFKVEIYKFLPYFCHFLSK